MRFTWWDDCSPVWVCTQEVTGDSEVLHSSLQLYLQCNRSKAECVRFYYILTYIPTSLSMFLFCIFERPGILKASSFPKFFSNQKEQEANQNIIFTANVLEDIHGLFCRQMSFLILAPELKGFTALSYLLRPGNTEPSGAEQKLCTQLLLLPRYTCWVTVSRSVERGSHFSWTEFTPNGNKHWELGKTLHLGNDINQLVWRHQANGWNILWLNWI